eukprot:CAMPEP_0176000922 /NCGR_PEP_ID=MMETSP0108-20121206/58076_1 /TAXON_ID=195067 ORGANISM="Goniomonas pacifica, Strain CCMP1869" /NCGR_SAMPLE_ID=MMETSP0108 /ASSEMBLY_ACC=CAM_ASM_000204 /LENGTH=47 /DNA_ID= /DNA_START= /DNA_END= /DNA_ORIENTATION=
MISSSAAGGVAFGFEALTVSFGAAWAAAAGAAVGQSHVVSSVSVFQK